jgi:sulfur-oxidizing protein SoxX
MNCARLRLLALLLTITPLVGVLAAGAAAAQSPGLDGRALAFDRGKGNCLSCHQIAGGELAGTIGPPLADMKRRFPDRKALIAVVADETKRNPQTVMPPFGRNLVLSDREIRAIVDFLYTL